MKIARREKILEIIRNNTVETQEQLVKLLNESGFKVTQATVSRDISELKLNKISRGGGRSCYTASAQHSSNRDRFEEIFKQTVLSVSKAGNLIVVKTLSGCASATAEAIDNFNSPMIVGTLAGDNTIFIAIDKDEDIPVIFENFESLILK